jgi:hypothetical protein
MKLLTGALLLLGSLSVVACPAQAGTSFEFLFSSNGITNDDQLLLHLAVGDYGYSRREIEPVLPRIRSVEDDLPIVLFLAAASGKSVEFIVGLRSESLPWSAVFGRAGVSQDLLFVGIDRDPGPPYGKAWGHWKKNPKKLALSDDDIRGLVTVQTGRRLTGLSALDIARAQGQGKSVAVVVADKKGRPHHAPKASKTTDNRKSGKPGRGKSGKGK